MTAPVPSRPKAARQAAAAPRAWQRMLSGRKLDLLDPSWSDIEIEDIAHGLARVARWNGQTKGAHAFSVAQHSLLVVELMAMEDEPLTPQAKLLGLLHDAPEYVVGDMISPFKAALGLDYKHFESRLAAAIHIRFGLPTEPPAPLKRQIKRADMISAYLEATQLAGFSTAEAKLYFKEPPAAARTIALEPLPPSEAQQRFLEAFALFSTET